MIKLVDKDIESYYNFISYILGVKGNIENVKQKFGKLLISNFYMRNDNEQ